MLKWGLGCFPQQAKLTEKPLSFSVGFSRVWLHIHCLLAEFHPELQMQPLLCTSMDDGVACESVHEDTSECATGTAFATCAGFLAFALTEMVS